MASMVLDSSAVLAHIGGEPGAEEAEPYFGDALISAVNLAEIVGKLNERGANRHAIRAGLARYGLEVVAFDEDLAERAGELRLKTREAGLSLGDRACLALAGKARLPVLTADRLWKSLNLSIDVRLLR